MDTSTEILVIVFCTFILLCLCCFTHFKIRAHINVENVKKRMKGRLVAPEEYKEELVRPVEDV